MPKYKKLFLLSILFFSLFGLAKSSWANSPVISPNPVVAVFVTGAYVTWQTDIASNSRIDYGTDTSYGLNVTNVSSVTHHALTISGLAANTIYHYKVTSGATISSDFTFTTYANPTNAVKTVGSGKTYATIQSCVNAMSSGDTCLVYAGTYNETVTMGSGSAGNYKTVLAQEAATVTGFNIGAHNYTAIKGFQITTGGVKGGGNASYVLIENNYFNSATAACVNPQDSYTFSWWSVRNNIIYGCGYVGIFLSGTNVLIEGNDISNQVNDCIYDGGLTNSVIRNNTCHDYNPNGSGQHLDFVQWDGGTAASFSYSLIEGNTVLRCVDTTHNCHGVILRNPGPIPAAENPIIRYNFMQQIDGGGILIGGGSSDYIPYARIYNNTIATEYKPTGSDAASNFVTFYIGDYEKTFNNISYNTTDTTAGQWAYPFGLPDTGGLNNYNIAYDSVYTNATWASPYTDEATYAALKNKNPAFTNYPYSPAIELTSPAKDAGGALTRVSSGCGTSTLVLEDARWFQPGWAGTNADWISVGSISNAVQISSITYNTNTIVLENSVSCTNGDPVWLYKKSDGAQILRGTAPDIGAYEYQSSVDITPPAAPRNVKVN